MQKYVQRCKDMYKDSKIKRTKIQNCSFSLVWQRKNYYFSVLSFVLWSWNFLLRVVIYLGYTWWYTWGKRFSNRSFKCSVEISFELCTILLRLDLMSKSGFYSLRSTGVVRPVTHHLLLNHRWDENLNELWRLLLNHNWDGTLSKL